MSLKGNLASVNLTEIFQMLSLSGREGTLFIYEGARKRAICFTKDGVSIRSRERNEANLIGKILVRLGKIDERDLHQAVETRRTSERLLGDVMVDMGACTHEDVDLALRIQSEEEIQDLFLNRSDAQFEYVDGYFPETDVPFVTLNVNSLLIEIARRTDEWEYIRRRIRGPREIYRFTGVEAAVEADVLAECYAHRVDPLIDGTHAVGEIVDASFVNRYEVCKLLAAYLDAGVIEAVPPDAIRQNARLALRMGDTEGAIRHYEYLMTTGDFPLDVMGEAAEAHEANRDFAEAAALLRRLGEELVRSGDARGAIDALRGVASYPRPEPEALRYLMNLVFDNPRAAAEFAGNIVEAGKTLVSYFVNHDQKQEALTMLERLIETFPDEVAFAVSLVNVYYEDNNIERAASECERLANQFLKRKRPSHAISLYKKLLVIDPERIDIRERIRKIIQGKKRSTTPGALPRIAIAVAVSLLIGGTAVVMLNNEGTAGQDPTGLDSGTLAQLFARAVDEKTSAAAHGQRASAEYTNLMGQLGDGLLANKESVLQRLRIAEQRFDLFEEGAGKAIQITETIRRQATDPEVTARAKAMFDAVREQRDRLGEVRARWHSAAQKAAERLRQRGMEEYEDGKLLRALDRFQLARQLATRPEWVLEARLDSFIDNIRRDVAKVRVQLKRAKSHEDERDWASARRIYLELMREFGEADIISEIRLPVEITSVPSGAKIILDKFETSQPTPAIVRIPPHETTRVELRKRGFETESFALGPFSAEGTNAARYQYERRLLRNATWTRNLRGRIESDPAGWPGRIAAVERNGRWFVFDSRTGAPVARDKLETLDGTAAGVASDGTSFFVPTLEGKIYAFDAVSCKRRPYFLDVKKGIYAAPVVAEGVLYVCDQTGLTAAYNVTGSRPRLLWREKTAHGVRAAPVVQGEDLVVVSASGEVTVIKRRTGNVVIRYELDASICCAPALAGDDDLVFATEDGFLLGVGRVTGDVTWRYEVGDPIRRTPPVRGRFVFVSPLPGELIAVDTKTGDETYRYTRKSAPLRGSVAPTNRIFFASGETLSAFAPRADGYGLAWTFKAKGQILAGPVVHEGAVFIGDDRGYLYRLEAND